jgi:fatty acid desaturase
MNMIRYDPAQDDCLRGPKRLVRGDDTGSPEADPNREAVPAGERTHYTDSFKTLRAELVRRGYYRKATGSILAQLALLQTMTILGLVLFLVSDVWPIKLLAIIVSGLGTLGVSTNGHTASHYAIARRKWLNELITLVNFPVSLGVSASFWWNKHVHIHHNVPNVIGEDCDAELLPYFALCRHEIAGCRGFQRFYYERLQALAIVPAIALNSFGVQLRGWFYLARTWRSAGRHRRALLRLDLASLLAHYLLFLALPMLFFPVGAVLLAYVLRSVVLGYAAFAAFAPAHYPAGAVHTFSDEHADFVLRQTATTINFRTGPLGRVLCAGVEYQIEHHLFPGISHVYYPEVSRLVAEFCHCHGYPYRSVSWARGIWESFRTFACPKVAVANLADWRSVQPAGDADHEWLLAVQKTEVVL